MIIFSLLAVDNNRFKIKLHTANIWKQNRVPNAALVWAVQLHWLWHTFGLNFIHNVSTKSFTNKKFLKKLLGKMRSVTVAVSELLSVTCKFNKRWISASCIMFKECIFQSLYSRGLHRHNLTGWFKNTSVALVLSVVVTGVMCKPVINVIYFLFTIFPLLGPSETLVFC